MPRDEREFFHFTTPQRIERELHLLQGMLNGVAIDRRLNDKEVTAIFDWCATRDKLLEIPPFCDVRDELLEIGNGRELSYEQREDLLWFCLRFKTGNAYYNEITSEVQRLHGLLAGIAADGIITTDELTRLRDWLAAHNHLQSMWPFDEIDTMVTAALFDGRIDDQEQVALLSFCGQFSGSGEPGKEMGPEMILSGICATDPDIIFPEKRFCFTGRPAPPKTKRQLAEMVTCRGGETQDRLTQATNYLVVGSDGSECWAFSCYGRKVEAAMIHRKNGLPIQIIHELDFLDAARDAENM